MKKISDDPRLEAVKAAFAEHASAFDQPFSERAARQFCAMIRAFLGEDAERKEVIDHTRYEPVSGHDNAPAPVAAGADPPWLDEAEGIAALFNGPRRHMARKIGELALRVANAQPRQYCGHGGDLCGSKFEPFVANRCGRCPFAGLLPVSDAEVTAARDAYCDALGLHHTDGISRKAFRAALEAAAKVRAGR